jgi:hypothetical protein
MGPIDDHIELFQRGIILPIDIFEQCLREPFIYAPFRKLPARVCDQCVEIQRLGKKDRRIAFLLLNLGDIRDPLSSALIGAVSPF